MTEPIMEPWPTSFSRLPALIVDIDETIAMEFDRPIMIACGILQAVHRQRLAVHYVTARPESTRPATERFLLENRLPGWKNLHFCPMWMASTQHKREVHARLAKEYWVLASIGDSDEEAKASDAAGIPFHRVIVGEPESAWLEVERILAHLALLRGEVEEMF